MKREFSIHEWTCHTVKKRLHHLWVFYPFLYFSILTLEYMVARDVRDITGGQR
jgi:hypothetical protein